MDILNLKHREKGWATDTNFEIINIQAIAKAIGVYEIAKEK